MRECNNQELIELESKRHQLTLQLQDMQAAHKQLSEDKVTLLSYLEERENAFHRDKIDKQK